MHNAECRTQPKMFTLYVQHAECRMQEAESSPKWILLHGAGCRMQNAGCKIRPKEFVRRVQLTASSPIPHPASVGAELPLARCAPRRRLSASRVNRRFLGIEERSFPFLSTRRSAVVRNRTMLHQQCMRMGHRAPESRGALLHGRRREQTAPNIRHFGETLSGCRRNIVTFAPQGV